jgi:hypothetical protein
MAAHRNSERIAIKVQDHPALQLCVTDRTMRVMVLCTGGNQGVQEIAFPYQCELKVNGGDIKANLRGLKNKPGSTRPVDITDSLRLRPASYTNNIELTYALTQKVGAASHNKGSEVRLGRGWRDGLLTSRAEILPRLDRQQVGPHRDAGFADPEEDPQGVGHFRE